MSSSDSSTSTCRCFRWIKPDPEVVQTQAPLSEPVDALQEPAFPSAVIPLSRDSEEQEYDFCCVCGSDEHPPSECEVRYQSQDLGVNQEMMCDEFTRKRHVSFGFPLPPTHHSALDCTEGRVIPTGIDISFRAKPCEKCNSQFHDVKNHELVKRYHSNTEELVRRVRANLQHSYSKLISPQSGHEQETVEIIQPPSPPIGSSARPIVVDTDSEEECEYKDEYDDLIAEHTEANRWDTSKPHAQNSTTYYDELCRGMDRHNEPCTYCDSTNHIIDRCPYLKLSSSSTIPTTSSISTSKETQVGKKRRSQPCQSMYCHQRKTSEHNSKNCQALFDNIICAFCGQRGHNKDQCSKKKNRRYYHLREQQYGNGHNGGNGPSNGPHGGGHNQQPPHGGSQAMSAK